MTKKISYRQIAPYFVVVWFVISPSSILFAQDDCEYMIEEATQHFELGQFDKLLTLIDQCYDGLSGKNATQKRVEAHKLKAAACIALDRQIQAKQEVYKLLTLKPTYRPSSISNSSLFLALVNEVRLEMIAGTVSSVSKKAESAELTPADLVIITAEQIKQRGYKDLEELFHDLAGFDISRSWGFSYSNIYQRGYRSAANTDRTLILINGIEDNSLFSNTAFISRQYPLSNIKRVEIINGPASTMYGANAFLGVINIITKDEQDLFKGNNKIATSAQVMTGSYNTNYADVTLGVKSERIAFTITGRYHTSQERDLSLGSGNPNDSIFGLWDYQWDSEKWSNGHYRTQLTQENTLENFAGLSSLDPNQNFFSISSDNSQLVPTTSAIAMARMRDSTAYQSVFGEPNIYSNTSENYYIGGLLRIDDLKFSFATWKNKAGIAIGTDDLFTGSNNYNVWASTQTYLALRYDKYISDRLSISSFTRYKNTTTPEDTRLVTYQSFANGASDLNNLIVGDEDNWQTTSYYRYSNQLRSELSAVYIPSSKFNAILGVEYRNSSLQGTSLTHTTTNDTLYTAKEDGSYTLLPGGNIFIVSDIGAYFQMTYNPFDSLYLTAGIRLDNNVVRGGGYGTQESTRIAIVYQKNALIFKGLFTQAIKDVSVFQRFESNSTRIANPNLLPEQVNNFELSIKYQPFKDFYIQVNGYNAHYNNILEQETINGKSQFIASGQWRIRGIVARINYRLNNFSFYTNYTYSDPINETNPTSLVGDIAKHQVNIGANGHFFTNKLNVNLRGNYVGNKATVSSNPLQEIPNYLIFNGAITVQNLAFLQGWTAQVTVNNILDNNILDSNSNEYYHPGIREADNNPYAAAIPQNRRIFWVKLYYDF